MSDIRQPGTGAHAVAFELARTIALSEKAIKKFQEAETDPRAYWLKLYGECLDISAEKTTANMR